LATAEVVLACIARTTTETGLEVHAWLDENYYPKGQKVTDAELAECRIRRQRLHGEWNYEIHPRDQFRQMDNLFWRGSLGEGASVTMLPYPTGGRTVGVVEPLCSSRPPPTFRGYSAIRTGTRDRKIAALSVVQDALLLSANRQDFEQVPGLRFDSWINS
jgi:Rhodopirellula transposase DDE domain